MEHQSRSARRVMASAVLLALGLLAVGWWMAAGAPFVRPVVAIVAMLAVAAWCTRRIHRGSPRSSRSERQAMSETRNALIEAIALARCDGGRTVEARLGWSRACALELGAMMGLLPADLEGLGAAALLQDAVWGSPAASRHGTSGRAGLEPPGNAIVRLEAWSALLDRARLPFPVAPVVLARHERFDGAGLPAGLREHQIPLAARILAVADSFATWCVVPQPGGSLTRDQAIDRLRSESGAAFDPEVVRLFLLHLEHMENLRMDHAHPARTADPLTRLADPRHLFGSFDREIRDAEADDAPLSIIAIDVARIDEVNARYGRLAGDRVLRGVARAIRGQLRPGDTCVRFAGDEFILMVPGVGPEGIAAVMARVEVAIMRHKFAVARGRVIVVTVSMGAASFPAEGSSYEDLMAIAESRRRQAMMSRRGRAADAGLLLQFPGHPDVPVN